MENQGVMFIDELLRIKILCYWNALHHDFGSPYAAKCIFSVISGWVSKELCWQCCWSMSIVFILNPFCFGPMDSCVWYETNKKTLTLITTPQIECVFIFSIQLQLCLFEMSFWHRLVWSAQVVIILIQKFKTQICTCEGQHIISFITHTFLTCSLCLYFNWIDK